VVELHQHYRRAKDPHERSRWHILWLLSQRQTARAEAASTGYSPYGVRLSAKRDTAEERAAKLEEEEARLQRKLRRAQLQGQIRQAQAAGLAGALRAGVQAARGDERNQQGHTVVGAVPHD
jgi:hypothetical protein